MTADGRPARSGCNASGASRNRVNPSGRRREDAGDDRADAQCPAEPHHGPRRRSSRRPRMPKGRTPTRGPEHGPGARGGNRHTAPGSDCPRVEGPDSGRRSTSRLLLPRLSPADDRKRSGVRWNQNYRATAGQVVVRFTIQRDGSLTDVLVERTGDPTLNIAAQRAVVLTRNCPPLPDAFPNPTLTVHLNFQYQTMKRTLLAVALAGPGHRTHAQQPPPQQPAAAAAAAHDVVTTIARRRQPPPSRCPISSRCRKTPNGRMRSRSVRCCSTTWCSSASSRSSARGVMQHSRGHVARLISRSDR